MAVQFVNNHIHTVYSFSPYTPAEAVRAAKAAGLVTCGIMDHDSIAGAAEFIAEGKKQGMRTTCGMETRISLKGTFLEKKRINNPDQNGVAYVALHGVPHQNIDKLNAVFAPYRAKRNERNVLMCKKIAELMKPYGISFDFYKDVLPLSLYEQGGVVTERHICCALARKLIAKCGKGAATAEFLKKTGLELSAKIEGYLSDINNPHYEYDVLGVLKSGLVEKFYVDADAECMPVADFIKLGKETGAIIAYAYLGDVGDSATGDKKTQTFEDGYLDELVKYLKDTGFDAITYMPSRNTGAQLDRIRKLCADNGLFEISGEDINSSRQSFICPALERPEFAHLIPATYALIGHEKEATKEIKRGMFTLETVKKMPALHERISYFEKIGRE